MGFMDQLQRYTSNLNQRDPLFGGLIPRREQIIPQMIQPEMQQQIQQAQPIQPRGAIGQLPQQNQQPGRVVFDWSRQENDRANRALEYENENRKQALSLSAQAGQRMASDDNDKNDIARRKQALDEWKARNPEGQVQVVNGRVHVVNKLDGSSIDTGLAGDHMTEAEKSKLKIQEQTAIDDAKARNDWSLSGSNAEQAKELERLRQQNRKELADASAKRAKELEADRQTGRKELKGIPQATDRAPSYINPSQQRVAEDDAAAELLRDPKYAWLARDGHVTVDKDGVKVNRAGASDTTYLDQFEQAWKAKAKERMNVTRDKPSASNVTVGTDAVPMNNPAANTGPKIGDVKTYPNGNKAKWDGTGWEMIPKE